MFSMAATIQNITAGELLEAALPHVPFDGWSEDTLEAAARELGAGEGMVRFLFPEGPKQAVELFLRRLDEQMEGSIKAMPLHEMKVRDKVAEGVMALLTHASAHKEAMRAAIQFLANPKHATVAANSLYHTVDTLWHAIGDTSTDFNFYTKRAMLAGVISTTTYTWLEDSTPDMAPTRAFLARRIGDVMKIEKAKATIRNWLPKAWRSAS